MSKGAAGLANAGDKRSQESSTRDEPAQLEFQRKNPHLFTTMSQSVGPYGEITTFDQVTANLQTTVARLQKIHIKQFGGKHPDYCMNAPGFGPNPDVCQAIELCDSDIQKVRLGFIENYKQQVEWFQARRERFASERTASQKTSSPNQPITKRGEHE